ncbi:DUF2283 domain-containing protein [Candidatus Woesearchaeota archaeon]|nr:DUF2283 domain-containing protein [Candidatus Woesearchaeota archaeon]
MKNRHLDGTGRGEILYDFKYDTLVFKVKDRSYKKSLEFQNFIIDIDNEDYVTGIRILDASKVCDVEKYVLKSIIHGEFKASKTDKNVITVTIKFMANLRNRIFPLFTEKQKFTQQFTTPIDSRHTFSVVERPILA